jgi:hypothetical protein
VTTDAVAGALGMTMAEVKKEIGKDGDGPLANAMVAMTERLTAAIVRGARSEMQFHYPMWPVVLAFVYYGCPMLCNQVQQGVVGTLRMLSFNPGADYQVVFISFDSRETPDMAAEKKKNVVDGRADFSRGRFDQTKAHVPAGIFDTVEIARDAAIGGEHHAHDPLVAEELDINFDFSLSARDCPRNGGPIARRLDPQSGHLPRPVGLPLVCSPVEFLAVLRLPGVLQ